MVYHIFWDILQFVGFVVLINCAMNRYVGFIDDIQILFISLKKKMKIWSIMNIDLLFCCLKSQSRLWSSRDVAPFHGIYFTAIHGKTFSRQFAFNYLEPIFFHNARSSIIWLMSLHGEYTENNSQRKE